MRQRCQFVINIRQGNREADRKREREGKKIRLLFPVFSFSWVWRRT